jgi:hypothetical protein
MQAPKAATTAGFRVGQWPTSFATVDNYSWLNYGDIGVGGRYAATGLREH